MPSEHVFDGGEAPAVEELPLYPPRGTGAVAVLDSSGFQEIVEFIAAQRGFGEDLVRTHVDDGTGHCTVCGGPQSGRPRFPCTIRLAADQAAQRPGPAG